MQGLVDPRLKRKSSAHQVHYSVRYALTTLLKPPIDDFDFEDL